MKALSFIYALHSCLSNYSEKTVFVDLSDCDKTQNRICYISTQYEKWRSDAKDFRKQDIGKPLRGWVGENWVNYKSADVRTLILKRIDLAKSKKCQGVDFDNVDGHLNDTGFKLTATDQKDFIGFLSAESHKRGLLLGLKNSPETAKSLTHLVDFHVAEECSKYKECDRYPKDKTFFIEYMEPKKEICSVRPHTLFSDYSLGRFKKCQ